MQTDAAPAVEVAPAVAALPVEAAGPADVADVTTGETGVEAAAGETGGGAAAAEPKPEGEKAAEPAKPGKTKKVDPAAKADPKEDKKPADESNPRPVPSEKLPPPTEEELAAWDRKDPADLSALYKWDKENLAKMMRTSQELECLRIETKKHGAKAADDADGWLAFKKEFIPGLNKWQQRLFSANPRILEKSKFVGHFVEAHELVMASYPGAYNDGDAAKVKKADAHWRRVASKVRKHTETPGGSPDGYIPGRTRKTSICKGVVGKL